MARASSIEPIVGDWYSSHGERFEVVAVDDDEGTIEVQYADGTLAEIDADDWSLRVQAGGLRQADPPEDASGGPLTATVRPNFPPPFVAPRFRRRRLRRGVTTADRAPVRSL